MRPLSLRRRDLIWVPMIARAQDRPKLTHGIQIGDVTGGRATIWGRSDRDSEMTVTIKGRTFRSSAPATAKTGMTARTEVSGLAPDSEVELAVSFEIGRAHV